MMDFIRENKVQAIGLIVAGALLILFTAVASASGAGVDHPPEESKRSSSVYRGGHFFIFYTGGPGVGARGVGGRSVAGGGFGRGK